MTTTWSKLGTPASPKKLPGKTADESFHFLADFLEQLQIFSVTYRRLAALSIESCGTMGRNFGKWSVNAVVRDFLPGIIGCLAGPLEGEFILRKTESRYLHTFTGLCHMHFVSYLLSICCNHSKKHMTIG